jgi:hypothetical protein
MPLLACGVWSPPPSQPNWDRSKWILPGTDPSGSSQTTLVLGVTRRSIRRICDRLWTVEIGALSITTANNTLTRQVACNTWYALLGAQHVRRAKWRASSPFCDQIENYRFCNGWPALAAQCGFSTSKMEESVPSGFSVPPRWSKSELRHNDNEDLPASSLITSKTKLSVFVLDIVLIICCPTFSHKDISRAGGVWRESALMGLQWSACVFGIRRSIAKQRVRRRLQTVEFSSVFFSTHRLSFETICPPRN